MYGSEEVLITMHTLFWPQGYKTFLCATQLSTKFILLINVKMSTIVGILTFISRINTTYSLVDKASASGAGGRRFDSQCRRHWDSF